MFRSVPRTPPGYDRSPKAVRYRAAGSPFPSGTAVPPESAAEAKRRPRPRAEAAQRQLPAVPPLPAVRPEGPRAAGARYPRRWSCSSRPGPGPPLGLGASPVLREHSAPRAAPLRRAGLCLAGGQNKAETGKGKRGESAAPAAFQPSAWISLHETALQADPDRGQGVERGEGGGRTEGGREKGREGRRDEREPLSFPGLFFSVSCLALCSQRICAAPTGVSPPRSFSPAPKRRLWLSGGGGGS